MIPGSVRIPTVIDSKLRVDANYLGADLTEQILDELTIINRAKKRAERKNRPGWWNMPDDFLLADLDGDILVMPVGYAMEYKLLLREHGHAVWWKDRRTWERGRPFGVDTFDFREHQPHAVRSIIHHQFGVYEAPTGSGKTVVCCAVLHKLRPAKALVMCDKLELLHQWRDDIHDHTGADWDDIGQIGGGKWNERRFTVATVQTLWRAVKDGKIDHRFFDQFSVVILDECHHVTADTVMFLFGLFSARYRIGVSATPDKEDDKFEFVLNVIGDIIHAESEAELRAQGVIVAPEVHRVETEFDFYYWGDHVSDKHGNCEVPGCDIPRTHRHRNNYADLKAALVEDPARNHLILHTIMKQVRTGKHIHLVVSDEIRHLEAIYALLTTRFQASRTPPVYLLTGQMARGQRKQIVQAVREADNAILLSTVAKEGLDIPAIDRIYLPFPQRNARATEQKIGRGTRSSNGKGPTLVFDLCDSRVGLLKKQYANRVQRCYLALGLKVHR
jgi:superfamily II DNA or RNA helicase